VGASFAANVDAMLKVVASDKCYSPGGPPAGRAPSQRRVPFSCNVASWQQSSAADAAEFQVRSAGNVAEINVCGTDKLHGSGGVVSEYKRSPFEYLQAYLRSTETVLRP